MLTKACEEEVEGAGPQPEKFRKTGRRVEKTLPTSGKRHQETLRGIPTLGGDREREVA